MSDLGTYLRTHREEIGLTQEQLASKIGVSKSTIVQYEQGAITPRPRNLVTLAGALERPPDETLAAAGFFEARVPGDRRPHQRMSESPSHEGSLASAQLTEPVRRAAQALFTTLQGSIAPEYWLEVVDALQGLVFVASRDVARQAVYEGVLTTTADALLSRQNLMDLLVDRLRASDA